MTIPKQLASIVIISLIAGASADCSRQREQRKQLSSLIEDSLGYGAEVDVGYLGDSSQLAVNLFWVPLAGLPDDGFQQQAKRIASMAVRHYWLSKRPDSISVIDRVPLHPGMFRIIRTATFPVNALGDAGRSSTPR